jgi:hypothetical protein
MTTIPTLDENTCYDSERIERAERICGFNESSEGVLDIIKNWIILLYKKEVEDIDEELKCNIIEFINAPIGHSNIYNCTKYLGNQL